MGSERNEPFGAESLVESVCHHVHGAQTYKFQIVIYVQGSGWWQGRAIAGCACVPFAEYVFATHGKRRAR
jgi:hypothetical protein